MERFDRYWIGIVLGLMMPAAFGYAYMEHFHLWSSWTTFGMALSLSWSKLLLLSVFPNLAFIFVFYSAEAWKLAKGLLIGALPYMIAAIAVTL